ncbi:MAG: hypothetical protein ACRDNO_34000, partial [Trebonia sp.]
VHELLAGFPAGLLQAEPELAAVAAADELARGSLEMAERYLRLGDQHSALVTEGRRWQHQVLLGIVRLLHARQRGDPQAVTENWCGHLHRRLQAGGSSCG